MKNALLDQNFLRKLDLQKNKVVYAKIILLTFNEEPVYEIQGKITAGSINIDGNSAVRRTCSLTMVSPNVDITNTYWALKNKFKLEIGIENKIDSSYSDIIWFKQGTYVFTSLNMNVQSNNFTISLNGKDKMCLLNGEVSGTINASTDFGQYEEYTTSELGIITRNIVSLPIIEIIKNAVHTYAGEPLSNIVLNDIDNYGLELLEYRGDKPLYMLRSIETDEVSNMTFEAKYMGCDEDGNEKEYDFSTTDFIFYNSSNSLSSINSNATIVYVKVNGQKQKYNVIKIEYGMAAGYRKTDLTYPGPLTANIGESLVSILDKIKKMFADFEYFYDVNGRFIFQRKKTYINTSFNNLKTIENEFYAEDAMFTSAVTYSFEDGILLSAFTDNPQILNIKNDFSIWGKRKGAGNSNIPIHMRYAIDYKPIFYRPIRFNEQGELITNTLPYLAEEYNDINNEFDSIDRYDWRELIYQMALDYYKYNYKYDNFTQLVATLNSNYYPTGITGYETYYIDLQGFWRQIYNPEAKNKEEFEEVYTKVEITQEEFNNNKYYFWDASAMLYKEATEYDDKIKEYYIKSNGEKKEWIELPIEMGTGTGKFSVKDGFNENVTRYPELLNFWFDFIEAEGEIGKYAISTIGDRIKTVNDDKITSIYFQETPSVLFLSQADYDQLVANREDYNDMTGYTFIQLTSSMENYFSISAQGKSAKDELDNLLYQHTYATENVNLTSIPIYHLQPNTRIFVNDKNTGINGEYIVTKITIPLAYNGTTAITTTKAVERIF